jgi:hypothetical protein
MQAYWTQPAKCDPSHFIPAFVQSFSTCGSRTLSSSRVLRGRWHSASRRRSLVWMLPPTCCAIQRHNLPICHSGGSWAGGSPTVGQPGGGQRAHVIGNPSDRHREQALQEVYCVLRPGGRVLVTTVAPKVALRASVPFRFVPKVAQVFVH